MLALAAAGCSSSGSGSSGGSGNGKVTITELDYFTSSGGNTALNWYNKKFEQEHPGVTVKRTAVAFANLITKVLQDASAGDMPSIVLLDNPNVPQVAAILSHCFSRRTPFSGGCSSSTCVQSTRRCRFRGQSKGT